MTSINLNKKKRILTEFLINENLKLHMYMYTVIKVYLLFGTQALALSSIKIENKMGGINGCGLH